MTSGGGGFRVFTVLGRWHCETADVMVVVVVVVVHRVRRQIVCGIASVTARQVLLGHDRQMIKVYV